MKTENNARLKYKIHHTRNMRRQNVTVQWHLYFAPITAIYRTHQAEKKQTNKKNVFNSLVVPIGTCGQPKESLFVEQAILKGKRGEKATAMKTLKRGWDYIVTFRVIFSYNVSYTLGPKFPCIISLKYVKYCWANFPICPI